MKKTTLSLLLIAAFTAPAFAAQTQVSDWKIEGFSLLNASSISGAAGKETTGEAIANAIIAVYRFNGYTTTEATVDEGTHTIKIVEAKAKPTGKYADYIKPNAQGIVTADDLELASARMAPAAQLDGEKVKIEVQSSMNGIAEIQTSGKPNGSNAYGGTLGYNNSGQRYSGPDVGTLSAFAGLGNAAQLEVSLAHGFPDASPDSSGGRFESGTLGLRKASVFGVSSLSYSETGYKVGGPALVQMDITGAVVRTQAQHEFLVTKELTAIGRFVQTENKQTMGAVDWTDRQDYASIFGGVRYQGAGFGGDIGVEQGVGGSRSYSFTPLLGAFDQSFTTLTANAYANVALGGNWILGARAGVQSGDPKTPSGSQFVLGGPDRGRSYSTGYAATPNGGYASLIVNAPEFSGVRTYAGIEGSTGTPVVGKDRNAQSIFVGSSFNPSKSSNISIGFAQHLGPLNDDASARDCKFNISLAFSM